MASFMLQKQVFRILIGALLITLLIWGCYFFVVRCVSTNRSERLTAVDTYAATRDVLPSQLVVELLGLLPQESQKGERQREEPQEGGVILPIEVSPEEIQKAIERMKSHPAVQYAQGRMFNGVLTVWYEMKRPRFLIGGYQNIVSGSDPKTFPLHPLYTPRELITLFIDTVSTKNASERVLQPDDYPFPILHEQQFKIAIRLVDMLQQLPNFIPEVIDVRQATASSWYRREIGVKGKWKGEALMLRLPANTVPSTTLQEKVQKITHFLNAHMKDDTCSCIDARFSHQLLIR
jgi:hypothetical protein